MSDDPRFAQRASNIRHWCGQSNADDRREAWPESWSIVGGGLLLGALAGAAFATRVPNPEQLPAEMVLSVSNSPSPPAFAVRRKNSRAATSLRRSDAGSSPAVNRELRMR